MPERIRKQIRYIGFWPGVLRTVPRVYRPLACGVDNRAAGIPASGGGVDIPCRRITASGVQKVNEVYTTIEGDETLLIMFTHFLMSIMRSHSQSIGYLFGDGLDSNSEHSLNQD